MESTINQLNKIALQAYKRERVVFRGDVCAFNFEMFDFIDESGFVSIQFLFGLLGLNQEITKVGEWIVHIGPLTKVISFELF